MFRHNLLLIYRNFRKNKVSFFINLIGLSTGLACTLFIFLWVQDELGVDKFHENDDRLYQVCINAEMPNGIQTWAGTPGPMANALLEELPEVEAATKLGVSYFQPKGIVSEGDDQMEVNGLFAGEEFFNIFTYPFIAGDRKTVLAEKNNIAISERTAVQLFGSPEAAMQQTIEWKNRYLEQVFQVAGVYENPPLSATNQFDVAVHYQWMIDWDRYADDWSGGYAETILQLREGTDLKQLNKKITQFYLDKRNFNKPRELFLRKYSDNYLLGNYENGVQAGGRIEYVRLFSIIALFILLIACVNFMNLSTAQASKKTKEIGVKKTIGATRFALVRQFLGESVALSMIALVLALALVNVLMPSFNSLTGKHLALGFDPRLMMSILGIGLLTGLFAGSYPALYLSGFNPIAILKGKLETSFGEQWIRKGLVVFQFALSVLFIVGVLVIQQQMKYVQDKHLGYEGENVLTFERPTWERNPEVFLTELENIPGVVSVGNMYSTITNRFDNQSGYSWRGEEADSKYLFEAPRIGYGIIETMGMEMKAGRSFSKIHRDSFNKIVINETAANMMQLENPIGHIVKKGSQYPDYQEIIGVVKDFHYGSVHKKVEPLIFRFRPGGSDVMVRLEAGAEATVIPKIEAHFNKFHSGYVFNFSFVDDNYQALYESENRVATLSKYFSGLAIIISCLGLLGLAMFTAEQRKKEIGIRKILGATSVGVVGLLSKDYMKLVAAALLVASPLSYLIMDNWLENFAYHISMSWGVFALTAVLIIAVALLTVGFQSVKAALVNPVESLRSE